MYAFSLPVYVMLSVPIAFGIDGFLKKTGPGRARLRWAVFITFLFPLALYPGFSHWPGREATIDRYISMYPESERLGGYWDPAEYIFNPIKSGYRVVEDFAAAWAERLPPGACYWDDESKAAMPLDFYYQRVRGMRPDVQLHRFFGLFLSDEGASALARDMELHLSRGDPVFISSLAVPEREIVNKLVRIFPRLKIEEIKLGGQLPSMYRLSP
jgi:hypothetical protein